MTKNQEQDMQNRDAKGAMLRLLMEIPEDERKELIKKYTADCPIDIELGNHYKIIIGTWMNRGVKAMMRGATDDEIHHILRVIYVAIEAPKQNLDVSKAITEEGMDEIMVKYIRPALMEERKKKDRQKQLDLAAKMTTVLEMHEKGFANQRIGEILGIPESTVRFFVKHKGGIKATGYTINKVEE